MSSLADANLLLKSTLRILLANALKKTQATEQWLSAHGQETGDRSEWH